MERHYFCLILYFVALLMSSSCQSDNNDFSVNMTDNQKEYAYLKDYGVIKQYVNENLKIATTVSVPDYINGGIAQVLANSNFNQVLAANSMDHESIVNKKGEMDFTTVNSFVETAQKSNISVFGSSLCSNDNQNGIYLNSLIAPTFVPSSSGEPVVVWDELFENGDLEKDAHIGGWTWDGENMGYSAGEGVEGSRCYIFNNPQKFDESWKGQIQMYIPTLEQPEEGSTDEYILKFDAKVDDAYTMKELTLYAKDGSGERWIGFPCDAGCENLTDKWSKVIFHFTVTHDDRKAGCNQINFDMGKLGTKLYIDNISLTKKGLKAQTGIYVEKTDEEKKEIITNSMNDWLKNMISNTKSYVNAWNVISNPIDDNDPSKLKSGLGLTLKDNQFFWQDYMGKDYARSIIKTVRDESADQNQTLFVSETGLENLSKCDGLINMINYWESDNITKIDGISVDLNVSYEKENEDEQKNLENNIDEMFKKLAQTGKLIRLAGLNIGLSYGGQDVKLPLYKDEHLEMSEFYTFIIKSYLNNVPASQQYGISKDNALDVDSEPIGLWDKNYNRKHTYAGFVEGLK